jgi:hypothetical protein
MTNFPTQNGRVQPLEGVFPTRNFVLKSSSLQAMVGIMCCCSVAPVFPLSPARRYADVTVHVHRYEGGEFVIEKLKAANLHAGVSCKEVEDPERGTVIKSGPGYFVVCGYALETSRLPSKNIIEISSLADTADSEAAEDKIFREFIKAIKGNPEVDSMECFVGKKFDC